MIMVKIDRKVSVGLRKDDPVPENDDPALEMMTRYRR